MTRIIAGVAGGRRLRTPPGDATRPTSNRVREALFSSLESELGSLGGNRFLDLYAGSGAIGLEASSRGAASVTLVEQDARTSALIRANARDLGLDQVTVVSAPVERLSARTRREAFDVVFLDPPYGLAAGILGQVLTDLEVAGWLSPHALVVVERSRRGETWRWPDAYEAVRTKTYGETMLWYGRAASAYR